MTNGSHPGSVLLFRVVLVLLVLVLGFMTHPVLSASSFQSTSPPSSSLLTTTDTTTDTTTADTAWQLPRRAHVVVTGATKGIGKALVEEFLRVDTTCQLLVCARTSHDLETQVREWNHHRYHHQNRRNDPSSSSQSSRRVVGVVADVSTEQGRQHLMEEITKWLDGHSLDVLIHNVGTNRRKGSLEYTMEDWQFLVNTNLLSVVELTRHCVPLMTTRTRRNPNQKQNDTNDNEDTNDTDTPTSTSSSSTSSSSTTLSFTPSILLIGSVAGVTCLPTGTPYAATKAALNQLTGNWACEFANHPIRVNCICPWYIATELAQQVLQNPNYHQRVVAKTPLGRIGLPREVAGLAVFLSLPVANYITGQVICVDGGFTRNGFYPDFV